jgi:hypothetical protein
MSKESEILETSIEELHSVITNYRETIKQGETKKITYYNKLYMEKLKQNINTREEFRLASAKIMIAPSVKTLNIPSFYDLLKKISRVYSVSLKIIPTLFLPQPASYLYTNSRGVVEISESSDSLARFFCNLPLASPGFLFPVCILKCVNSRIKLFASVQQAQRFLETHPDVSGIMQEFVLPASDTMSVCKVLQKDKRFKYSLVTNKNKFVNSSQKERPRSVSNIRPRTREQSPLKKEGKRRESMMCSMKPLPTPDISLLQRLRSKVLSPWEVKSQQGFEINEAEYEKFLVSSSSLASCYPNSVNTSYPEIETMIKTLSHLLKRFYLSEKMEISECFCEFVRDRTKTWLLLGCSQIKITSTVMQELLRREQDAVVTTKADSESEMLDDVSMIIEEHPHNAEPSNPVKPVSPANPLKPFNPVTAFLTRFKTQLSFKVAINPSFNEKFRKTISKIDEIRHRSKPTVNVALKKDLAYDYKNKLQIDRHGNISKLMLERSEEKPFAFKFENKQIKRHASTPVLAQHERLISLSKAYNKANALEIINEHASEAINVYEKLVQETQQMKFPSRKIEERFFVRDKIYGQAKFTMFFTNLLIDKARSTELCRFIRVDEDQNELFCSGLMNFFDCKMDLTFASMLYYTHLPLQVTNSEYDIFTEIFLSSMKEFVFTEEDLEFAKKLLHKQARDICCSYYKGSS